MENNIRDNGAHPLKRVVVVGAGFAGLNLVKHLDAEMFDITVIDRDNYHYFPPLFAPAATPGRRR